MDYHNYFIGLEDRFAEISKYVEVDERNYSAFSAEIALVYLAACSEFEVVSLELCKVLNGDERTGNIEFIYNTLAAHFPEIHQEKVNLRKHKLSVEPFIQWTGERRPAWWTEYNAVKHSRINNYHCANLKNLIDALAALEIVNHFLVWKRDCPNKSRHAPLIHMQNSPKIFRINNINYDSAPFADDVFTI